MTDLFFRVLEDASIVTGPTIVLPIRTFGDECCLPTFFFIFIYFFLNPSLLSFEAWPHVGLYIRLCYPLAPSASFASISVAVLSFRAGLTPSDRSPHGTVYQPYTWGIILPTIGIEIEGDRTTARVLTGWVNEKNLQILEQQVRVAIGNWGNIIC